MKVPIECPIFRAYLQKEIPAAFEIINAEHEAVKNRQSICIDGLGVSYLSFIEHLPELEWLDIDNNPKIKHLPRLPSTLRVFYSNHKFETSKQPVFFLKGHNIVMLDDGSIIRGGYVWGSLDKFKTWVAERDDAGKFAKFISECEAYLLNIKNKTHEK